MAEKLRSIIRPIPWSSLLKAAALGLLWYLTVASNLRFGTSFLIFAAGALIAYFVPPFRPRALLFPLSAALLLAAVLPRQGAAAFLLGCVFLLVLGIKDLAFLDRETAYEVLVFLFIFGGSWSFYYAVLNWISLLTAGTGLLLFSLFFYGLANALPWRDADGGSPHAPEAALSAFLFLEAGASILFLPLDHLLQSLLLFAAGVFVAVMLAKLRGGQISERGLYYGFGILAIAAGFVLVFAGWGI